MVVGIIIVLRHGLDCLKLARKVSNPHKTLLPSLSSSAPEAIILSSTTFPLSNTTEYSISQFPHIDVYIPH